MSLLASVAYSAAISTASLVVLVVCLRTFGLVRTTGIKAGGFILAGVALNLAGGLVHELAHALVASYWGFDVRWGGNFMGQQITTQPQIYNGTPVVQVTTALAGPLVSLVVVCCLLRMLVCIRNADTLVVASYLFYTQGLGGFGSVLYVFSGDAVNFAQGLAKMTAISLGVVGYLLMLGAVLWTVFVLMQMAKALNRLKQLAET